MTLRFENGLVTAESLRQLLIDYYISKPQCHWSIIIKLSDDFGKCPLNAIRIFHDEPTNIKPLVKFLRKNGIPVLHVHQDDISTHTITLMSHSNEN